MLIKALNKKSAQKQKPATKETTASRKPLFRFIGQDHPFKLNRNDRAISSEIMSIDI
ncbi:hypothetical protein KBD11_01720 [Candidatus Saccharibacteria bacterium]|nr:hypothetical protein [Candidatus Saccharibacteria bacterium]